MIRSKLNLVCSDGHRFFSPIPNAWVGRPCLSPLADKKACQCVLAEITLNTQATEGGAP